MNKDRYGLMVDQALEKLLPKSEKGTMPIAGEIPELLSDAMRYSLLSGGKRLRPAMLLAAVDMLGGDLDEAMPAACAVEMIHCYSLIHDDLPGMDNDVLRRGKPTNHVVYGVGTAILAGDGLLSMAFEHMLQGALAHPEHLQRHVLAISEIARGAGVRGMVAGQTLDLQLERRPGGTLLELQFIHENKTASLFVYALRAAARLCDAPEAELNALDEYARAFGLLFQNVDDLLDVEGDEATLGKSVGKDESSGKLTAVKLYGLGGARGLCEQFLEDGLRALEVFGDRADHFRRLIEQTASRNA